MKTGNKTNIHSIIEEIKVLSSNPFSGFQPSVQQWKSFDRALCKIGENSDWYALLYHLTKYEGWSSRRYAWKYLRDKFAPNYKKWLCQKKKEGTNKQLTLYDIFDNDEDGL